MIVAKIARNIPLAIFMHYDTLLFYLTGVKYGFYPKNMASGMKPFSTVFTVM